MLAKIKQSLDIQDEISCFDVNLLSSELIARNAGMQKEFSLAVKRRANALTKEQKQGPKSRRIETATVPKSDQSLR